MKKIKKIIVTSYTSDWPQIFEQEASKIKQVLGSNCIAIHHVGSTSVLGLSMLSNYEFFHIGMIYRISGCRSTKEQASQELKHIWIDPKTIAKDQCSSLLWKYKKNI
jgi:hypothetical protein